MELSPVKVWRNQAKVRSYLGATGVVESYTYIHVPPVGFSDQAPYPVALVSLEDGRRLTCQLVDFVPDQIKIGQRVQVILRRIKKPDSEGVISYGVKCKPI